MLEQVCVPAWVMWIGVFQGALLLMASLILMRTSIAMLRSFRRFVAQYRRRSDLGWLREDEVRHLELHGAIPKRPKPEAA